MLLKLRGGMNSFFVTALLGVLIASFAIFGIGSSAFTSSNQQVASVGDTPISTQTYYNRVQNRARALQAQYGAQYSVQQLIQQLRLDQNVLQQMLADAASAEHLSKLGMRAGNDALREELESYEGFVLPDGTLSKEMVLQALNNTGLTRSEFMNEVRRGISQRHLAQSFIAENMVPRAYAETLYVWQAERRRATMIDIKAADIANIAQPTEEELQTYYDLNKGAYRTEERRTYNYVIVSPKQFMTEIEIEEDQIVAEYDARRDDYIKPEQRGLQQVSFADKAAADAFLIAVKSGADFVEAGASVTEFSAEEIELGDFAKSEIVNDYGDGAAEEIFALADGGVTEPIEGFGSWNVFKVASITAAQESTLEDVREEITTVLKEVKAEDRMYEVIDAISEAMAEESELSAIANVTGLTLATVSNVNRRGQSEDGDAAATQSEEFTILGEAFSQELGTEADMLDLDPRDSAKGVFMVEVSEIKEPADRVLEDVKSDVTTAWLSEKRLLKAAEIAETARERLANGEEAEAIAVDLNGTSFEAKNVVRTGETGSSLSSNIRRLIFDLNKDGIDVERASDGNGYVVVRVDEVTPGDPTSKAEAIDTLLAQMNNEALNEVFYQYQSYLSKTLDVKVNTALQQSLFTENIQQ